MASIRTMYKLYRTYRGARSVLRSLGIVDSPVVATRSTTRQVAAAAGLVGGGILVGAGLALLFAPVTGRELRTMIGQHVGGMVSGVTSKVRRGGDAGENGHSTWDAE